MVLDGGACAVGVESTIIDCTTASPRVLRPGAISIEMIEKSSRLKIITTDSGIRVSGSLENHYAPKAKVILDQIPNAGQGFLALAEIKTPEGVFRLASPRSSDEFAQVLYSSLREADSRGISEIVIAQPSGDGIALAIRDRLARASSSH